MDTLIITGGSINEDFLTKYLSKNKFDLFIAVDKGLDTINKLQIKPSYIIGDFDSVNNSVLKEYENKSIPIEYLNPEKDYTDTHMALKKAIEIESNSITIIGAIGTRIDHSLANIHILKDALENGVKAKIVDEHNEIMLIQNETIINKSEEFKYVSILPLTTEIKGITIEGLKYKLNNATLKVGESIGISNEQTEEKAIIKIKDGIAVLIFSKD